MTIDETWAVPLERVRQFFDQQPDVHPTGEGFTCGDCRILLTRAQGNSPGPWVIPRTHVRMEGRGETVKALHRRFFLRFLSAGG